MFDSKFRFKNTKKLRDVARIDVFNLGVEYFDSKRESVEFETLIFLQSLEGKEFPARLVFCLSNWNLKTKILYKYLNYLQNKEVTRFFRGDRKKKTKSRNFK